MTRLKHPIVFALTGHDPICAKMEQVSTGKPPKPFAMIREFHLADWFTLGNAVCGTASLFATITYVQTDVVAHVYFACALIFFALVFDVLVCVLCFAAVIGATGEHLWFGRLSLSGHTFHPLTLLFGLSGSMMISRIHIPKL
jgi:hypothetical protein